MADDIEYLVQQAEAALGIEIFTVDGRAAYHAPEVDAWYWLSLDDLRHAIACRAAYGHDAYSHWCAGSGEVVRDEEAIRRLAA